MNKYVLCAILISFFSLSIHSAENNKPTTGNGGGWRESYGGDSTIMEFKHVAKEMVYVLNDNDFPNYLNVDLINLKEVINLSYIECGTNLVLDGAPKDAINYPHELPQRIVLDCKKWSDLSTPQKYRLAIHEYLPLVGIDDSTYAHSEKMFNFFSKYKSSANFEMKEMMSRLVSCNVVRFRELTDLGGNIFLENKMGSNLLQIASAFSCNIIVQDLIDFGLEYVVNDILTIPYAHYSLIMSVIHSSLDEENSIKTLQVLIRRWPGLVNLGFKNTLWVSGEYQLEEKCFPGSTIMHLLATKDGIKKENINYIKKLIELGFSIDQKNICGQTPREFFEKRNIHF